jgi:hypothetical protein
MVLILIITLSLIFRILLSPTAFHVDILSNASWGEWIFAHGPLTFYNDSSFIFSSPTQPPLMSLIYGFDRYLYSFLLELFRNIGHTIVKYRLAPSYMIWWFNFTVWFDTAKVNSEYIFSTGYLSTIKLLPILADILIGIVIYFTALKAKLKKPLLWSSIYLFSPFTWYISALWGQYDQLSFLLVFLSFILISHNKLSLLSPILFFISFSIKPTSLIFIPLFLGIAFISHKKWQQILIGSIMALIIFVITTQPFTTGSIWQFSNNTLKSKIFSKSEYRLSTNSYNSWRILIGNQAKNQNTPIAGIPGKWWGVLAFLIINFIAFKQYNSKEKGSLYTALFIVGTGSWLFLTNMLERYLFAGMVSGLFVCIYQPKLFKLWLLASFIFWINLFHGWWYPTSLNFIKDILVWNSEAITRLLSILNLIIFIKMISLIHSLRSSSRSK